MLLKKRESVNKQISTKSLRNVHISIFEVFTFHLNHILVFKKLTFVTLKYVLTYFKSIFRVNSSNLNFNCAMNSKFKDLKAISTSKYEFKKELSN
jgi:hypothetical protein